MRVVCSLVVVAMLGMPGVARAGRSYYGWLYGTEVLPERSVELQQWVWEEDDTDGSKHTKNTSLWWGPLIGITDQLELALPVEFLWESGVGENTHFTFHKYGAELRYRLVTQDPVDRPAFAPLLRLAVKRDVTDRDATILEADVVAAYDADDLQLAADVGIYASLASSAKEYGLHPAVGFSYRAVKDLRFGAEGFASIDFENKSASWAAVGPNMAWTHGRFWMSASFGIGVYQIKVAPRFQWGVLF